jgi:hypothetical protein
VTKDETQFIFSAIFSFVFIIIGDKQSGLSDGNSLPVPQHVVG